MALKKEKILFGILLIILASLMIHTSSIEALGSASSIGGSINIPMGNQTFPNITTSPVVNNTTNQNQQQNNVTNNLNENQTTTSNGDTNIQADSNNQSTQGSNTNSEKENEIVNKQTNSENNNEDISNGIIERDNVVKTSVINTGYSKRVLISVLEIIQFTFLFLLLILLIIYKNNLKEEL